MKYEPRIGLIGAGGLRRSYLTELPSLQAQLGPIKAASFSVARKYAKSLRAGYPVQPYSALELCPAIWVAVPDARLRKTLEELAASISVAGIEIIICSAEVDSVSFPGLQRSGAFIATVNALDPDDLSLGYVAEGHAAPLKRIRKWFRQDRLRVLQVHQGTKPYLRAGCHLVGPVLRSAATAALEYLRAAGLKPRDALELIEHLGAGSLHAANHAASGAATLKTLKQVERGNVIPMDGRTTHLDSFYRDALALAIRYYSEAGAGTTKGPLPPGQESGATGDPAARAAMAGSGKGR